MAKYIGPKCRLCRTEGKQLFLKGERCFLRDKCAVLRRQSAPGMHGGKRRNKMTGYGEQLREKQKIKKIYGVLEKQFRIYVERATNAKGVSGTVLLQLLERRFDNVVTRASFAPSRSAARQFIVHGHYKINGKKVDVPSYILKPNDVVEVTEKAKSILPIKSCVENASKRNSSEWLEVEPDKFKLQVKRMPERTDIDPEINENLVIEFYSR
jgi:small subunit ribosomal protein S4